MEGDPMTIYEKMMSIMADVQYLAKDDRVEFGNTKYKALSEEKVTSIMRAELLKHKLVVFPIDQTAIRSGSITHVDVRYRMVNVENPEEFIEIVSCGQRQRKSNDLCLQVYVASYFCASNRRRPGQDFQRRTGREGKRSKKRFKMR